MKRIILPRRPWLTAGLVVASLVLITTLTLTAFNLRPVHASGVGSDIGLGCSPTNGAPTCHFSGAAVFAQYVSGTDSTGCIYSQAGMILFDNIEHDQAGAPTGGPELYVGIWKEDLCSYTLLEDGSGYTTAPDFKHDAGLESASVNTMLQLTDPYTGTPPINVTINLTWKGFGPVTSIVDGYQTRTAHSVYKLRFTADNRMAVVTGTFSDGTTNYAATPSMFPIYDSHGGTLEINQQ